MLNPSKPFDFGFFVAQRYSLWLAIRYLTLCNVNLFFENELFLNDQPLFEDRNDHGVSSLPDRDGSLNDFAYRHSFNIDLLHHQRLINNLFALVNGFVDADAASGFYNSFADVELFFDNRYDDRLLRGALLSRAKGHSICSIGARFYRGSGKHSIFTVVPVDRNLVRRVAMPIRSIHGSVHTVPVYNDI